MRRTNRLIGRFLAGMVICGASLPAQSQDGPESVDLKFGVYTTDKPTVMYRTFTPILEAIETAMQQKLRRPVAIELKINKSYTDARKALVTGKVDFVRFGPASYVLAKHENPRIQLLAMETNGGKKTFEGYIVVRQDSPIKTLAELRGKRFAFGDPNSTIGRYLAQKALLDAKVRAEYLAAYEFLGRHDKVFRAVQLKHFDAGAVKSGTFHKLNTKKDLRVIAKFDNVTKPWVARSGLGAELRQALSDALKSVDDKAALEILKSDRFVAAKDKDYDVIRTSMAAAKGFNGTAALPIKD